MGTVRRSRLEWEGIIREYRGSGKSAAQFALERGVNKNTLSWWSAEFKCANAQNAPVFLEVIAAERPPGDPFVVVLAGSGHQVVVPPNFVGAELRRLVGALC